MSKASRDKGRRGQREAGDLLKGRDWSVAELNSGTVAEDMLAVSPEGVTYSVEVKNTVAITVAHRDQAMRQAKERRIPWMLISKIAGTSSWLVQKQGERPVVWSAA